MPEYAQGALWRRAEALHALKFATAVVGHERSEMGGSAYVEGGSHDVYAALAEEPAGQGLGEGDQSYDMGEEAGYAVG